MPAHSFWGEDERGKVCGIIITVSHSVNSIPPEKPARAFGLGGYGMLSEVLDAYWSGAAGLKGTSRVGSLFPEFDVIGWLQN